MRLIISNSTVHNITRTQINGIPLITGTLCMKYTFMKVMGLITKCCTIISGIKGRELSYRKSKKSLRHEPRRHTRKESGILFDRFGESLEKASSNSLTHSLTWPCKRIRSIFPGRRVRSRRSTRIKCPRWLRPPCGWACCRRR